MSNNDWNFYESAIEITLAQPDDFLKVRETLTRIGIASKKQKILYQSCHILQKKKRYWLVHFKELFALDGKEVFSSVNDIARRNSIANLLADWKLLTLVNPEKSKNPIVPINQIKILRYDEKKNWTLMPKYSIGNVSSKTTTDDNLGNSIEWINNK